MNTRTRRSLAIVLGTAAVAVPLIASISGVASAAEDPTEGYPSTQNPLQVIDAGGATTDAGAYSLLDAANGANRPEGADGTDSRIPGPDPRFVEGPAGGLLDNGPFE